MMSRPHTNTGLPHLHFFCGKPGAGKTTLALAIANSASTVLLSEDIWLTRLVGDQMQTFDDYKRFAPRLRAAIGPLVVDILRSGVSVVADFQANTRAGRAWFRSLFEGAGVEHTLHYLKTPDLVCLSRISRRNAERPEGSHQLSEAVFWEVASYFEEPGAEEAFVMQVYELPLGTNE